ncbi:glycogen synthase GlgA [Pontibacillus salicampi]|uniref:Glycogen synthase n=1 Tax=Pontibacillus salicampi TaxID=1449801 RepID=A0ABV6LI88_9BACI
MNILFAAAECVPFVKTGGLGDVVGSLPQSLQKQGVDARVILPKYKTIPAEYKDRMTLKYSTTISLGWRTQSCKVEELIEDGVHYYFIDNPYYFGRNYVYGNATQVSEAERYVFFVRAILEVLPAIGFQPDIIHAHDWQTAILPLFLQTHYQNHPFYLHTKTLFTIHNVKYQGIFPKEVLADLLQLEECFFTPERIEYYGQVNFMKAGIVYADKLTTVSHSYAKDIQTEAFGEGLHGVIKERQRDLLGIPSGIDYKRYNPYEDAYLAVARGVYDWKAENKRYLQQRLQLPVREVPMLALVTRLVSQKGIDLILASLPYILDKDVQLVILGRGERDYELELLEQASHFKHKLSVNIAFDEALAHQLYGAADLFLMPSLYEPSGLSHLIALQYETIPVVRETGGLKDTVLNYDEDTGEGNGFTFRDYSVQGLTEAVDNALDCFQDPFVWWRIHQNVRRSDYSWDRSSLRYKALYDQLALFSKAVTL